MDKTNSGRQVQSNKKKHAIIQIMLRNRKLRSTTSAAHELVKHINSRLEIMFNTVHTQLANGITRRTLLHDIDGISAEINRYLNSYDRNKFNKLCKYHLKGTCWFGDNCWYEHNSKLLSRPCTPQPKQAPKPSSSPRTRTPPSRWVPVVSTSKPTNSTKTMPYWRSQQLAAYSKKTFQKTKKRAKAQVCTQQPSERTPSPQRTVPKAKQQPSTTVVTSKVLASIKTKSKSTSKMSSPHLVTEYRQVYLDLVSDVAEKEKAFNRNETKTTLWSIRHCQDPLEMRKLYVNYCHVLKYSWVAKEESINILLGIARQQQPTQEQAEQKTMDFSLTHAQRIGIVRIYLELYAKEIEKLFIRDDFEQPIQEIIESLKVSQNYELDIVSIRSFYLEVEGNKSENFFDEMVSKNV